MQRALTSMRSRASMAAKILAGDDDPWRGMSTAAAAVFITIGRRLATMLSACCWEYGGRIVVGQHAVFLDATPGSARSA
jgi:hypothetical protein